MADIIFNPNDRDYAPRRPPQEEQNKSKKKNTILILIATLVFIAALVVLFNTFAGEPAYPVNIFKP